jgi:hypothetical protein
MFPKYQPGHFMSAMHLVNMADMPAWITQSSQG